MDLRATDSCYAELLLFSCYQQVFSQVQQKSVAVGQELKYWKTVRIHMCKCIY